MSFSARLDPKIVAEIAEEYKNAAIWLPFSAVDIKAIFSEGELKEAKDFIEDVEAATMENEKLARIETKIAEYSSTVLKLLQLAKIV